MKFIYTVTKAQKFEERKDQHFSVQAVMKAAAPFIHYKDNVQGMMNKMCGHVVMDQENCGNGGRQGEVADEIFNNVILEQNIFDDDNEIFLI